MGAHGDRRGRRACIDGVFGASRGARDRALAARGWGTEQPQRAAARGRQSAVTFTSLNSPFNWRGRALVGFRGGRVPLSPVRQ